MDWLGICKLIFHRNLHNVHLILPATIDCTPDIVTIMACAVLLQPEQQVSDEVKLM